MDMDEQLLAAARSGDAAAARAALDGGASCECKQYDQTPLAWAAQKGHQDVIRLLLERGADVNVTDGDGQTPLHQAAYKGLLEIARLMLDRGANVDAPNLIDGTTPLQFAAVAGQLEVVRLLLERGANKDAQTQEGKTVLDYVVDDGDDDVDACAAKAAMRALLR